MKKISKLKLIQFSKAELDAKHNNALKGGRVCACVCAWCGCVGGIDAMDATDGGNTYVAEISAANAKSTC